MKRRPLILIAMMAMSMTSFSQVYEVPYLETTGTLVRWWRDSTMVVYVDSLSESRGFLLYTQGQPVAKFASLPASEVVHDMRIVGDEVYFCGTKWGQAMVGSFHITNVFAGTDPIHSTTFSGEPSLSLSTIDFKRLEVFQYYGVKVMALVGETMMSGVPNTTVASVYQMGGFWYLNYLYNKDTVVRYTDITCLDDMVVAVGTRADHRGCCFRAFGKVPMFPSVPSVTPHVATEILTNERAVEKVLARDLGDNHMALAYHGEVGKPNTWLHDIRMSPATGLPIAMPNSFYLLPTSGYPYSAGWDIKELSFRNSLLYIQEEGAHLGLGMQSWLHEWDPHSALPQFKSWSFASTSLYSSDIEGVGDRPITSGTTFNGTLELRGAITGPANMPARCNYAQMAYIKDYSIGFGSVDVVDDVLYEPQQDAVHHPVIRCVNVNTLCVR